MSSRTGTRASAVGYAARILAVLLSLGSCRTVDRTLQEAHIPCGVYRWPVKTLTDPDAGAVRFRTIQATVRGLVRLPRPPGETHRRWANEFYVYRVRALLVAVHTRIDQDLHLWLRDPDDPSARMIAEIPNPPCAARSRYVSAFAAARRMAEILRDRPGETLVDVTGVGFFDAFHDQIGGAPNEFELHPVLELVEVRP